MAVHPAIKGLTVTVKVDGKTATEYPTPLDFDPRQICDSDVQPICCFIESSSGLSFKVEAATTAAFEAARQPYDHLILRVSVDGHFVHGLCNTLKAPLTLTIDGSPKTSTVPGCEEIRRLMFSDVSGVDDATKKSITHDINVARELGLIKAFVFVAHGKQASPAKYNINLPSSSGPLKLAEKAMKGRELTHGTTISNDFRLRTFQQYFDFRNRCKIAEFWFLYRSRGALQREMILPPSPSPRPTLFSVKKEERKRPVDLTTLDRRTSQNDVKPKKLKSCDDSDILDLTGIAPFRSVSLKEQSQEAKFKREPEVIDLTGL
ncbi:hypothetical protein GQ602_004935 [Ophiocordyceps camponoti-floridani]|uniref:DUF7918 domain-containing protein n=1 Tax=Ophiocordyceps camponoti-floridani TaxID=2030778 RepID=A0A8H4VCI1_9HYPO|nr:hypothetical protein GQ602_004935 [Ophiocordyceps camponoti-floridani]